MSFPQSYLVDTDLKCKVLSTKYFDQANYSGESVLQIFITERKGYIEPVYIVDMIKDPSFCFENLGQFYNSFGPSFIYRNTGQDSTINNLEDLVNLRAQYKAAYLESQVIHYME